MAHEKVYVVCEDMCMEEGMTKEQISSSLNTKSNTDHTHDDRYYTESEMNTKLASKSDTSHNHDSRYYTESESDARYKLKGDFAVVTGSGTVDSLSGLYKTIDLPSGFTITNCVIVSFMYGTGNNRVINYQNNLSSIGLNASTNKIEMYIDDEGVSGKTVNYTIVLMKIS